MNERTVSVNLFSSVMEVYRLTLGSPEAGEFKQLFDFDLPGEEDSEQRIPLRVVHQIVEYLAKRTNDPVFGLRWSECSKVPIKEQVLKLFLGSHSLKQMLEMTARYIGLMSEAYQLSIRHGKDCSILELKPGDSRYCGRHQVSAQMVALKKVIAMVQKNALKSAWFTHSCPEGSLDFYLQAFGVPVLFNQPVDGLEFKAGALSKELPGSRINPSELIHIELRLNPSIDDQDIAPVARIVVAYFLEYGVTDRNSVAKAMGMSLRTMQRRLQQRGTSFREILESVRFEKSGQLLSMGCYSYEDIAFILGYKDIRSFYHAFQRWTGTTPGRQLAR